MARLDTRNPRSGLATSLFDVVQDAFLCPRDADRMAVVLHKKVETNLANFGGLDDLI